MRVLVCGQRSYNNQTRVLEVLRCFPKGTIIIHGAAKGADTLADGAAKYLNFSTLVFPAHWKHSDNCPSNCEERVGKAAGVLRNEKMLREGKPDLIIAFYNDKSTSKGTVDMVKRAANNNVEVWEFED